MKWSWTVIVLFTLLSGLIPHVNAQVEELRCGDLVESVFTENGQTHEYSIQLQADMMIIATAESKAGNYQELAVDMGFYAPSGFEIIRLEDYVPYIDEAIYHFRTDPLSETGTYQLYVRANTSTGGSYELSIACVNSDGAVISSDYRTESLECGTIIEKNVRYYGEVHRYFIDLGQGDQLTITAAANTTSYQQVAMDFGIFSPTGHIIDGVEDYIPYIREDSTEIATAPLSESGVYLVGSLFNTETGGSYLLTVSCVLADGTIVRAGDTPIANATVNEEDTTTSNESVVVEVFSGFGFPGVDPIDFSTGVEIPIELGESQIVPLGAEGNTVALYTYEANAGSTATLSLSRLNGNLSMGVAVINKVDNVIVFLGGLPTSDNLLVELTFPSDGTYVIGVFRLDITYATGTSGAVEVALQ